MLLRSHCWGKFTFLQMLASYYDKSREAQFNNLFGQLYIGKHPTANHNTLLVLLFDFSTISTFDLIHTMWKELKDCIRNSLQLFLSQNKAHIQGISHEILNSNALEEILVSAYSLHHYHHWCILQQCVQWCRQKVFVGFDYYNAPANTCLFSSSTENCECFSVVADFFKTRFFAILKKYCSCVIQKYWITGVLFAFWDGISLLCATNLISDSPLYNGVCGLTEGEVFLITKKYLGEVVGDNLDMVLEEIKRQYSGYKFCSSDILAATSTTASFQPSPSDSRCRQIHEISQWWQQCGAHHYCLEFPSCSPSITVLSWLLSQCTIQTASSRNPKCIQCFWSWVY